MFRDLWIYYGTASVMILMAAYRIGHWSAVWNSFVFLVALPLIVILTLSLCLYARLFFEKRKNKEKMSIIKTTYPEEEIEEISPKKWAVISKSTGKTIAKIHFNSKGELVSLRTHE